MRSFRDNDGRRWTIRIDVRSVERVRALADVDLYEVAANPDAVLAIADRPAVLVDVVAALCAAQIAAYPWREPFPGKVGRLLWTLGLGRRAADGQEQFGLALGGMALDEAWDAILWGLHDFFTAGRRATLRTAVLAGDLRRTLTRAELLAALDDERPPSSAARSTRSRAASAWTRIRGRLRNWWRWTAAARPTPPG